MPRCFAFASQYWQKHVTWWGFDDRPPAMLRTSIEEVRPGYGRQVLETESLPVYLPKRRWFASKTETLTGVHIPYAVPLPFDASTVDPLIIYIPHNSVLYVWLRTGLPGALAYWMLIGSATVLAV